MAKTCSINRNLKRIKLVKKYAGKRDALKKVISNKNSTPVEIQEAQHKLNKLPRNSSPVRIHNRCELTGRSHGTYRKTKLSRIKMRELALEGQVPGMTKSSW
ncbi:MAG: 30S ribosomal protein S14 [Lactobacillales bacterium]|jgi:small subunit ribosomal protein S14|nr:30S ribosomal protein S14 [Lactobacillales bacterium]